MRRTASAAFVLMAAALFSVVRADVQTPRDRPPAPAGNTSMLAGRVTVVDRGGQMPVRRARVTLDSTSGGEVARVDTDTDGRFAFERLPAGHYRVVVEKAGFVRAVDDPRRAFGPPPAFDLAAGQAARVDVAMRRAAAVDGVLVDETGEPVMNVVVSASRYVYDASGRRLAPARQARTDDRGHFRIHTLPAGEYFIDAAPDPLAVSDRPVLPGAAATILAHTYYPGTARLDQARAVTLTLGEDLHGIDFALDHMAVVALRGHVLDSAGRPATAMMVRLQRVGGPVGEVRGIASPESGDFEYRAVPPGLYWMMAVARPQGGTNLEFAAERLDASGQTPLEVTLRTAKGAAIAGHLEAEGAAAIPGGLRIVAYETAYQLPGLMGAATATPPAAVDAAGAFAFPGLFGPRLVRVDRLPSGWALRSIHLDDRDVTDTPLDFKGMSGPHALRIVVTPHASAVSGLVRNAQGQPVAGARVVVFAADEHLWGYRSRFVVAAEAGADGRYRIDGLLGGDYLIAAAPFLDDQAWIDPEVLQRLRPAAAKIALTEGEAATMNFDLR